MKKIFLLAIFIAFSSTSVFASHVLGAEITWEDAGTNQIAVTLKIYRECLPGSAGFFSSKHLQTNIPGMSILNMAFQSSAVQDISPVCLGPGSISCNTASPGAVELGVYKSAPIYIPQPIPAAGYTFTYAECCRASSAANVTYVAGSPVLLTSVLLPNSTSHFTSPDFLVNDLHFAQKGSLNFKASTPQSGDSLYYDFYNISALFSSGYSASSPLPNPSSTWLDHQSGLLHYDMSSATAGTYVMGIEVECWRNNQLISVIRRDAGYTYLSNADPNNNPDVIIDTAAYTLSRDSTGYTAIVQVGDTLNFQVSASDFDYLPSGVPQTIKFSATGSALDASWGGGFSFQSKPVLAPVAPQSGFSSQLNNNISFNWATGVEHLQGQRGTYDFVLSFKDNSCPVPGQTNIPVRVIVVQSPSYIKADTLSICQGDSALLSGRTISQTYQWSPQTDITSTSVAQPLVYPASSGYYYLEDPQSPGYKDSVYVLVEQRHNFNLSYSNSILQVEDSVGTGSRTWYYNGIPFTYSFDTLTPFGPGQYSVQLVTGSCKYHSDTMMVQPGSFSVIQPGNGGYYGHQVSVPGSIGLTFSLDGSGNLSSVSIPGVKDLQTESGGYDLTLKIYDQNQQEQLKKSIVLQPPFEEVVEIPLNFPIMGGVDYTIALTGDTSYAFSLYESVSVPFTPWNNGLHVKGYSEGQAGYYPQSATDYLLPLTMEVSNFVSLKEVAGDEVLMFPNPASESVSIKNLVAGAKILLYDASGNSIREMEATGSILELQRNNLASGVYLLKIETEGTVTTHRLIFR